MYAHTRERTSGRLWTLGELSAVVSDGPQQRKPSCLPMSQSLAARTKVETAEWDQYLG